MEAIATSVSLMKPVERFDELFRREYGRVAAIAQRVIGQRASYFCPHCQR